MKSSFTSFLVAAAVLLALPSAFTQSNSTRVLTDVGTGNGIFSIDGMEPRGAGLYWWKYGASGESNNYQSALGIKGGVSKYSLSLDRSGPFYMIQGGILIGGAERDGTYAYFTADGLYRQSLSSVVNATPERLVAFGQGLLYPGAIGRSGPDLFLAATYSGGYTEIRRASFDEAGNYTGTDIVAAADLHPYPVRKFLFFNARIDGTLGRWGLCLQGDGALWRFGPLTSALQPMVFLTNGVGDIGVRSDDGGVDVQLVRDRIYATTDPVTGGVVGKLVEIDPGTGALTLVHAGIGSQKFVAFGFDNNFFFISRTGSASGEILRKFVPYRYYISNPLPPPASNDWESIEDVSGTNLRSDGRWLYFTRGNEIRRVGTDIPPIRLDIEAFGVEAVQIVQDFNNSVPLIAGKPVLVRGYARLATNSDLAKPTREPAAIVSVTRNNVGVGVFYPMDKTTISNLPVRLLTTYRRSATQSFNFVIPAEEVQSGTMSFTFHVNHRGSINETGVASPSLNVVSTPTMQVVATGVPKLICMPVQVDQLIYTFETAPTALWNQIHRAISLLPIPDIEVRRLGVIIKKPVYKFPASVVLRSFDLSDNEAAVMTWIRFTIAATGVYFGGGDTHFLGMVHPGIENGEDGKLFNGKGSRPGEVLVVRMEGIDGTNAWDKPRGGQTLAHELGHNYGLTHVDCASSGDGPENTNGEYPGDFCKIVPSPGVPQAAVFGWDPRSDSIIDGENVGDLMSYKNTAWLSPYSLNRLRGLIASENGLAPLAKAPAPAVLEGEVFLISGLVNTVTGRAELWPSQRLPAGTYNPAAVAASITKAAQPQGHNYVVRQMDAVGTSLSQTSLILEGTGDGFGEKSGFVQFVAAAAGAVALEVANGTTILAYFDGRGAAPTVVGKTPNHDAELHLLQWSWSADDADGDPLFSSVHFSADNGANWQAADLLTGNSSVTLDTNTLPGGPQCLLRVVVTDGFNGALAVTEPFALPTHAPEITIIGATDGQKLSFGTKAELAAFAVDIENGSLPGAGFSWVLSGPEPGTKTGRTLSLTGLPPGTYSATASVIDPGGEAGSATLTFEVLPISIPAGAPNLDGEVDDPAYASAALVQWASGPPGRISARLIRSDGRLYIGLSELPYRAAGFSGYPSALVGLRVDVDGSADAAVQSSDLGFFLDEDGRPGQLEGNGVSMVQRANLAAGFETAVNSGELSWTAEFCLPEAILGGGEHGVRIMFTMDLREPGGGGQTFRWPAAADANSPATWAPVQLGDLPAPTNAPPLAYAGGDRVLDPAEAVSITLDGSGSSDPEAQTLTYHWTQVAGPTIGLTAADTAQPFFTLSPTTVTSTRRFQLVVNDGELDSPPDEIAVTCAPIVLPTPPRDVPLLARYPDGSVEGYFPASQLGSFESGEGVLKDKDPFSVGTQGLYAIETSEDLVTWTPRGDASPDLLGRLVFSDLSAASLAQRFYRAIRLDAEGVLAPGSALQFDGAARSVQVSHTSALNGFPFTVSAWINTTDTGTLVGGIASKYADASANGWSLFTYGGSVRGSYFANGNSYVWDGGLGLDGGFVADGAWHHVVMVIGAAGGTLYVDGAARGSLDWVGTPGPATTTEPLRIGRYYTYANSFTGQIDEVSVWSAALSGLEVLDLRRRGPVGTETNLQALWQMDDGAGTRASDSTENTRHGTLLDDPLWVPSTAPIWR